MPPLALLGYIGQDQRDNTLVLGHSGRHNSTPREAGAQCRRSVEADSPGPSSLELRDCSPIEQVPPEHIGYPSEVFHATTEITQTSDRIISTESQGVMI